MTTQSVEPESCADALARRRRRRRGRLGRALVGIGLALAVLHLVRHRDELHLLDPALAEAVVGLPLVGLVVLSGVAVLGRMGPAARDQSGPSRPWMQRLQVWPSPARLG